MTSVIKKILTHKFLTLMVVLQEELMDQISQIGVGMRFLRQLQKMNFLRFTWEDGMWKKDLFALKLHLLGSPALCYQSCKRCSWEFSGARNKASVKFLFYVSVLCGSPFRLIKVHWSMGGVYHSCASCRHRVEHPTATGEPGTLCV